ncbi:MAG: Zn-ribbon domain-containing OB-fold protein [Deltaproteobacteria bacterium]|nr:Zn-ribbon domain-containing OB-fold protein [Deltaproteobacteria bacterium]
MTSPFPTPVPNPDNQGFWEACARGELRLQRCTACRAWRHHPRPLCPACGSFDYEWGLASGRGVVHTFTIVHRPTLPAFEERLPYNVIVVRLEEGVFMVSNLVGADASALRIGLPVEVVFEPLDIDITLPKFRPRAEVA